VIKAPVRIAKLEVLHFSV